MTTPDTKISIHELTNWELHWLCVEVEYNIADKDLQLPELLLAIGSIEGRREAIFHRWDEIYDHPTGLRDALKKMPKYIELNQRLHEVKQKAFARNLQAHRAMLESSLGIEGPTDE